MPPSGITRHLQLWLIGSLLLIAVVGFLPTLVPYPTARGWIDSYSDDGSADPFTPKLYGKLRLAAGIVSIGCISLIVLTIVMRRTLEKAIDELQSDWRKTVVPLSAEFRQNAGWLSLMAVVALITRLPWLFRPLRFDEGTSWLVFASQPFFVTMSRYDDTNNHILHNLLMGLSAACFGSAEWSLRLPALVFGCLLVPLTGWLALRCAQARAAGILASLMVAGSSIMIEYSILARGYTIICCCTVLMWILAGPAVINGSIWAWIGIVGLTVIGGWTIPVMLYPATGLWCWLFLTSCFPLFGSGSVAAGEVHSRLRSRLKARLTRFFVAAFVTVLLAAVCYSPVLIVSGPTSLSGNVIVKPMPWEEWWSGLPSAAGMAIELLFRDWQGMEALLILLFGCGLVSLFPTSVGARSRQLAVFATLLSFSVTLIQRVHPPSRIWQYLIPLMSVLASCGAAELARRFQSQSWPRKICRLTAVLLFAVSPGINLLRTSQIDKSTEAGAAPGCPQAIPFLKSQLREAEPVIACCPASSSLKYYAQRGHLDSRHFDVPFTENVRKDSAVVVSAHGFAYDQSTSDVLGMFTFKDAFQGWTESTIGEVNGLKFVRLQRPAAKD